MDGLDKRSAFIREEVERVFLDKLTWVDLKVRLNTRERATLLGILKPDGQGGYSAAIGDATIDLFAPWVKAWGGPGFCPYNGTEGHECSIECRGPAVTNALIDSLDPDVADKLLNIVVEKGRLDGLYMGKANARSANGSTTRSSEAIASPSTRTLVSSSSGAGKASRQKK